MSHRGVVRQHRASSSGILLNAIQNSGQICAEFVAEIATFLHRQTRQPRLGNFSTDATKSSLRDRKALERIADKRVHTQSYNDHICAKGLDPLQGYFQRFKINVVSGAARHRQVQVEAKPGCRFNGAFASDAGLAGGAGAGGGQPYGRCGLCAATAKQPALCGFGARAGLHGDRRLSPWRGGEFSDARFVYRGQYWDTGGAGRNFGPCAVVIKMSDFEEALTTAARGAARQISGPMVTCACL